MSMGKKTGMVGKDRIGCYGTTPDNPTKAEPLPPAKEDRATIVSPAGAGGVKGAGKGMRSK